MALNAMAASRSPSASVVREYFEQYGKANIKKPGPWLCGTHQEIAQHGWTKLERCWALYPTVRKVLSGRFRRLRKGQAFDAATRWEETWPGAFLADGSFLSREMVAQADEAFALHRVPAAGTTPEQEADQINANLATFDDPFRQQPSEDADNHLSLAASRIATSNSLSRSSSGGLGGESHALLAGTGDDLSSALAPQGQPSNEDEASTQAEALAAIDAAQLEIRNLEIELSVLDQTKDTLVARQAHSLDELAGREAEARAPIGKKSVAEEKENTQPFFAVARGFRPELSTPGEGPPVYEIFRSLDACKGVLVDGSQMSQFSTKADAVSYLRRFLMEDNLMHEHEYGVPPISVDDSGDGGSDSFDASLSVPHVSGDGGSDGGSEGSDAPLSVATAAPLSVSHASVDGGGGGGSEGSVAPQAVLAAPAHDPLSPGGSFIDAGRSVSPITLGPPASNPGSGASSVLSAGRRSVPDDAEGSDVAVAFSELRTIEIERNTAIKHHAVAIGDLEQRAAVTAARLSDLQAQLGELQAKLEASQARCRTAKLERSQAGGQPEHMQLSLAATAPLHRQRTGWPIPQGASVQQPSIAWEKGNLEKSAKRSAAFTQMMRCEVDDNKWMMTSPTEVNGFIDHVEEFVYNVVMSACRQEKRPWQMNFTPVQGLQLLASARFFYFQRSDENADDAFAKFHSLKGDQNEIGFQTFSEFLAELRRLSKLEAMWRQSDEHLATQTSLLQAIYHRSAPRFWKKIRDMRAECKKQYDGHMKVKQSRAAVGFSADAPLIKKRSEAEIRTYCMLNVVQWELDMALYESEQAGRNIPAFITPADGVVRVTTIKVNTTRHAYSASTTASFEYKDLDAAISQKHAFEVTFEDKPVAAAKYAGAGELTDTTKPGKKRGRGNQGKFPPGSCTEHPKSTTHTTATCGALMMKAVADATGGRFSEEDWKKVMQHCNANGGLCSSCGQSGHRAFRCTAPRADRVTWKKQMRVLVQGAGHAASAAETAAAISVSELVPQVVAAVMEAMAAQTAQVVSPNERATGAVAPAPVPIPCTNCTTRTDVDRNLAAAPRIPASDACPCNCQRPNIRASDPGKERISETSAPRKDPFRSFVHDVLDANSIATMRTSAARAAAIRQTTRPNGLVDGHPCETFDEPEEERTVPASQAETGSTGTEAAESGACHGQTAEVDGEQQRESGGVEASAAPPVASAPATTSSNFEEFYSNHSSCCNPTFVSGVGGPAMSVGTPPHQLFWPIHETQISQCDDAGMVACGGGSGGSQTPLEIDQAMSECMQILADCDPAANDGGHVTRKEHLETTLAALAPNTSSYWLPSGLLSDDRDPDPDPRVTPTKPTRVSFPSDDLLVRAHEFVGGTRNRLEGTCGRDPSDQTVAEFGAQLAAKHGDNALHRRNALPLWSKSSPLAQYALRCADVARHAAQVATIECLRVEAFAEQAVLEAARRRELTISATSRVDGKVAPGNTGSVALAEGAAAAAAAEQRTLSATLMHAAAANASDIAAMADKAAREWAESAEMAAQSHLLFDGPRASAIAHYDTASFPRTVALSELRAVNMGEVIHHHRELWLYPAHSGSRSEGELVQPWRYDGDKFGMSSNTADIRFPRKCPNPAADADTRAAWDATQLSLLNHDMAQAYARMGTGFYTHLNVSKKFSDKARSDKYKHTVGAMLDEIATLSSLQSRLTSRDSTRPPGFLHDKDVEWRDPRQQLGEQARLPAFTHAFDAGELLREHDDRFQVPKQKPRMFSCMCGVGGADLAAQQQYYDIAVLVDACEENCKLLKEMFPNAVVLCRDVTDTRHQRELLLRFAGQMDAVFLAFPCQAVSNANRHQRESDARLDVADAATKLAIALRPRQIICEDVASFNKGKHKVRYNEIIRLLEQDGKYSTLTLEANAKHLMLPQQRNRLFIVATHYAGGVESALRLQQALMAQRQIYKDASSKTPRATPRDDPGDRPARRPAVQLGTCPTVRQLLQTYGDTRRWDAVFLHQLARMGREEEHEPARMTSIDDVICTLTSKFNQSAVAFDNYKPTPADYTQNKAHTLRLTPSQLGVLSGFSSTMHWSDEISCPTKCVGCYTNGKRRGRVGDLQRGNVLCPATALFLFRYLVRDLAAACVANSDPLADVCHLATKPGYEFMIPTAQQPNHPPTKGEAVRRAVRVLAATKLKALLQDGIKDICLHSLVVWLRRRLDRLPQDSELRQAAPRAPDVSLGAWALGQTQHANLGLQQAILDSGASTHFASGDSKLSNTRPGTGSVMTANAQREHIREEGDHWPLTDISKVNTFDKSLISIARLCELVGSVQFRGDGKVLAVSAQGGKRAETVIGNLNKINNLYDYDHAGLVRHCKQHHHLLPNQGSGHAAILGEMEPKLQLESAHELKEDLNAHYSRESESRGNAGRGGLAADSGGNWHAYVSMSDEAARIKVVKLHQRLNHASMKDILTLFDTGADLGLGKVTRDQLLGIQFFCSTCEKGKMTRKPWSHKNKKKAPATGKVGERIWVDLVFRSVESEKHITELGGRAGGGNTFTLVYLCVVSGRVFLQHLSSKTEVEDSMMAMKNHIEMVCRGAADFDPAADYDPDHPTQVLEWISDRDSNMTSWKATTQALEHKVWQSFTCSDGTNQTARLDGCVRRLLNHCRTALVGADLPEQYWEFGMDHAAQAMNLTPTSSNADDQSPLHRWTGKVADYSKLKAFGADCYVRQRPSNKIDKISPNAIGGNGRFRYLCEASNRVGNSSKGSLILDTRIKPLRISVIRDYTCNEDMTNMGQLEFPLRQTEDRAPEVLAQELVEISVDPLGDPLDKELEDQWHTGAEEAAVEMLDRHTVGSLPASYYQTEKDGETFRSIATKLKLQGRKDVAGRDFTAQRLIDLNAFWLTGKHGPKLTSRHKLTHTLDEPTRLWLVDEPDDLVALAAQVMYMKGQAARRLKGVVADARRRTSGEVRYAAHSAHYEKSGTHDVCVEVAGQQIKVDDSVATIPYWACATEALPLMDPYIAKIQALARELVTGAEQVSNARYDKYARLAEKQYATAVDHHWRGVVRGIDALELGETRKRAEAMQRKLAEEEWWFQMDAPERAVAVQRGLAVSGLEGVKAASIPQPKNYWQAVRGDFAKYWNDAIQAEIQNLEQNKVFEWIDPPPEMKIRLDSSWAFKMKPNDQGFVDRAKARLVARGFRQLYGVDYIHTMAPVGKIVTFRTMLAEMARRGMDLNILDIKSAYLEADLDIPQYMKPPAGVKPPRPGQVMKLLKSLYGLRNSGRNWHDKFRADLLAWGFEACNADTCLFQRRSKRDGTIMRVLLFVDDMAITSDKGSHLYQDLVKNIESKYKFSQSEDSHVFLGMAVTRISDHMVFLGQQRYIHELLSKYNRLDVKPVHTVQKPGLVSKDDCPDCEPGANPLAKPYREMIGELRWIERCTRPDLATALSELGKVQLNPGQAHMDRLYHLMDYLSTTRDYGITFGADRPEEAIGPMVGFVDANWGGDNDDYRSRGGYIFKSWGAPVAWASFRLTSVALSSCEAEFMAASEATKQATWLRYLMSDMGYGDMSITEFGALCNRDYIKAKLSGNLHRGEVPITIFEDNKGTISLSQNDVMHKRSRHIHIRYQFVRHHYQKNHVELVYINTKENCSDLMTKCLKRPQHYHLIGKLLHALTGKVVRSVVDGRIPTCAAPAKSSEVDLSRVRRPWGQRFVHAGWEMYEAQASSSGADYDEECRPAHYWEGEAWHQSPAEQSFAKAVSILAHAVQYR